MKHLGTKTLETERLLLRKSTAADADAYDDDPKGQKNYIEQVTAKYDKPDFYYWTIAEKTGDKAVGYICTVGGNEEILSCEIAYETKAKYRSNGYASEALKRVLKFLLIEVEYNRISAGHLADNPASGKVMKKAGMKYEGTRRQDIRNSDGILVDSKLYGILREDLLAGTPDKPKQKLIIISGSPCVGKSTVAEPLCDSYDNSARSDGDGLWCVNSKDNYDSRLRNGDKNMSFVLANYLNSDFEYVIFSSVVMTYESIRQPILKDIAAFAAVDYEIIVFTLTCSEETLIERHDKRGDEGETDFHWLRLPPHPGDYLINTDNKTVAQIVDELRGIIDAV